MGRLEGGGGRVGGGGGSIAVSGVVDQAGDHAGTHRSRTSGAERKTRADAPHPETGNSAAADSQPAQAATGARTLSLGIQRSASARSAGHANASCRLPTIPEEISVTSAGTGIPAHHACAQSP